MSTAIRIPGVQRASNEQQGSKRVKSVVQPHTQPSGALPLATPSSSASGMRAGKANAEDMNKWTVTMLKEKCRQLKVKVSGSKSELIERILCSPSIVSSADSKSSRPSSTRTDCGHLDPATMERGRSTVSLQDCQPGPSAMASTSRPWSSTCGDSTLPGASSSNLKALKSPLLQARPETQLQTVPKTMSHVIDSVVTPTSSRAVSNVCFQESTPQAIVAPTTPKTERLPSSPAPSPGPSSFPQFTAILKRQGTTAQHCAPRTDERLSAALDHPAEQDIMPSTTRLVLPRSALKRPSIGATGREEHEIIRNAKRVRFAADEKSSPIDSKSDARLVSAPTGKRPVQIDLFDEDAFVTEQQRAERPQPLVLVEHVASGAAWPGERREAWIKAEQELSSKARAVVRVIMKCFGDGKQLGGAALNRLNNEMGGDDLNRGDLDYLLSFEKPFNLADPGSMSMSGYEAYVVHSLTEDFEGTLNDFRQLKIFS
jgi:hypothetical protein